MMNINLLLVPNTLKENDKGIGWKGYGKHLEVVKE